MDLLRRVEVVKKDMKLTNKDLAALWDVSEETVKGYWRKNARNKIPRSYLEKLADTYQIDKEWLIHDKKQYLYTAPQLKGSAPPETTPEKYKAKINLDLQGSGYVIPFYSFESIASPVSVFSHKVEPTANLSIPSFSDCTLAITFYGKADHFEAGTILLCKEVDPKGLIIFGTDYLIVTGSYSFIRKLYEGHEEGKVIAASECCGTQDIPINAIEYLYIIKGSLKRHSI